MQAKRLTIQSGSRLLHAKLDVPANNKIVQYALFAHCFTCTSDLSVVRHISRSLTLEGIAVLRFDFAGLGRNEGNFSATNFSSNVADLIAVYNFMKKELDAPEILIGHSLGGTAVLMAAQQLPAIKALVTIGSPSTPSHVSKLFGSNRETIESQGEAEVNIGGRPFKIKKQFLEDIKAADLNKSIAKLKKPYLILHSPQDTIVNIQNAAELYSAAFHPKSFISLNGADHLLSRKEDAIYAANMISSWAKRYITTAPEEPKLDTGGADIVGHLNLENNFTTEIYSENHHLIADEPKQIGGDDLGMSPYELLSSSPAACSVMTIKMYAQRKELDLKEVFVYIKHEKRDQTPTEDNPTPLKIDHFSKRVVLIGNLDDNQRKRLVEIASRCPVHRTLAREVIIETTEAQLSE